MANVFQTILGIGAEIIANGFKFIGYNGKAFSWTTDVVLDQDLQQSASPTFNGMTLGSGTGPVKATSGSLGTGNIDLTSEVINALPHSNGGTGLSGNIQEGAILRGDGSNGWETLAPGTNGQVLESNGTTVVWANKTEKAYVEKNAAYTLVNGDRVITYHGDTRVELTLPETLTGGEIFYISSRNAVGWKLKSNADQTLYVGDQASVTGATGYVQSTGTRDAVKVVALASGEIAVYPEFGIIEVYQA